MPRGLPPKVSALCLLFAAGLVGGAATRGAEPSRVEPLTLRIEAGDHARRDTPVRLDLPAAALPASLWEALTAGPCALAFQELHEAESAGDPLIVQAERLPGDAGRQVRLTALLTGETPAGSSRSFRLDPAPVAHRKEPWSLARLPAGQLELKNGERTVFRYNFAPSSHPNYGKILSRDAYIHPAFTPTGALITGDFSKFHPHHRGFFLAYTKTQFGTLHPDFWNIQSGSGRIVCERVESTSTGPVTARFVAHHRWEAKGGVPVLRERWDVEAYDIPGQPYWLFDITSTQQAVGEPLELPPYRYGGMAYRGAEPFVKGPLDVLTSEGSGRLQRDQKPARWVDLTGPIADGSSQYAGAMIADHAANINHPTVARIHPTTLPFFSFVPSHDRTVVIGTDQPTVFRYRVLIHDGRPDKAKDEQIWADFAEPPRVSLVHAED